MITILFYLAVVLFIITAMVAHELETQYKTKVITVLVGKRK